MSPRSRQRSSLRDGSSSSSNSSPERAVDDDNDGILRLEDDSSTSIGELGSFRNMTVSPCEPSHKPMIPHEPLSPVYRLPPELLIAVFGKLSSPVDLRNCMLVSKQWSSCSVELLWHRPSFTVFDKYQLMVQALTPPENGHTFFDYPSLIKRLNLNFIALSVNDGSIAPLVHCTRLERLTLAGCSALTNVPLKDILAANNRLQALDLSHLEYITDDALMVVADNCPRLQGLNILGCKLITDASLIPLSQNRRMLRRLKLNECNQITDDAIFAFAENCPHLLEIDLFKCHQITDAAVISLFSNLRHLREVRLAYCDLITDSAFLKLPPNRTYEALRILDLTDCGLITDDAVEKIVKMAPRLRNLILAKCRHLTDRAVHSITKLGKTLHNLHLGHCSHITDRAVRALTTYCTRIRYIDLACCLRLTDTSVSQLALLPKLRRIGLVKCNNITDFAIQSLTRSARNGPCPLERVHLSYCMHLTVDGITDLVDNCQRLTHLSLTGVEAFYRRPDFRRYCRAPPKEFNDNQRAVFCVFSGHGVKQLRTYLKQLRDEETGGVTQQYAATPGGMNLIAPAMSAPGTPNFQTAGGPGGGGGAMGGVMMAPFPMPGTGPGTNGGGGDGGGMMGAGGGMGLGLGQPEEVGWDDTVEVGGSDGEE